MTTSEKMSFDDSDDPTETVSPGGIATSALVREVWEISSSRSAFRSASGKALEKGDQGGASGAKASKKQMIGFCK